MQVVRMREKKAIEDFLRRDSYLHLYALGDLDDFFWPHTTWYALADGGHIAQLVLLYTGSALPVLLALADQDLDLMAELLSRTADVMPGKFYAHLSGDLSERLSATCEVSSHGRHFKMALRDQTKLPVNGAIEAQQLNPAHANELQKLYAASYPGNWFDPRMLATGCYFGVRRGAGELISAAGVHVYSSRYRVAALGNVATRPDWRGKGLARTTCAQLCRALAHSVDHIGLNVKANNTAALTCYESLGFEIAAAYEECYVERK